MNRRLVLLIVGLILSGSLLAFSPAPASAAACTNEGSNCKVGVVGPGGGIVFYDAGSMQWWGRFLEAKPDRATTTTWGAETSLYVEGYIEGNGGLTIAQQRQRAKQIGMGKINTSLMVNKLLPPNLQSA